MSTLQKVFLAMFVFLSFIFTCNAGTTISYKGLDNVHINVDENFSWLKEEVFVIIKVKETDEILLNTVSKNYLIQQKIHHENLTPGTYTYELWWKTISGKDFSLGFSIPVTIDGTIYGLLLFDEIIEDIALLSKTVVVPENITLTLKGTIIDTSTTQPNISVNGNLYFEPGSSLQRVHIYYNKPATVDGAEGSGYLHFNSNSSGSTVSNCKGMEIFLSGSSSVDIENSEVGITLRGEETSINIVDSVIFNLLALIDAKICNFTATNTAFIGDLRILVDPRYSPTFENCEFASPVTLYHRSKTTFDKCVFGYELIFDDIYSTDGSGVPRWDGYSTIQPTFSDNSFVGRKGPVMMCILPTPIDLGTNYYGDKKPIILEESTWVSPPMPFLTRNIFIGKKFFKVTSWNTSGPEMKNQKKLPDIWISSLIVGQNCLSHDLSRDNKVCIKGRETLLSLDIATNYTNVSGVKFKAIFDGQEIQPLNPDVVLHRDISNLDPQEIFLGNTTVNFILPPTDQDKVNLVVKMDTTGIEGFDDATGKTEKEILNMDLEFDPLY